jgi:hypothetical protein
MTIAKHRITAISTSPGRLLAQLRDFADTDEVQSFKFGDPGPSGFDFSEDEAKRVLEGQSLPYRTSLCQVSDRPCQIVPFLWKR